MNFELHRRAAMLLLITAILTWLLCGPARAQEAVPYRGSGYDAFISDDLFWLMAILSGMLLLCLLWDGAIRVKAWWTGGES